MILSIAVSLVVVILTVLFIFYKWQFQYWRRRNVPYLKPQIPFGNISNPIRHKENLTFTIKRIYNKMKKKQWKHGGVYFFFTPTYLVINLDYLKNIMTKDFQYFMDRGIYYYNEKDDPLSAHLVNITGIQWRNMRNKLTPTFTSTKMKMMFQILVDCVENLLKKMDSECEKKHSINIKEILACFTTDIIGSCAFGLECKTFEEDAPFRIYGKKLIEMSNWELLKQNFANTFPNLALKMGVVLRRKDVSDFYMKVIKDTIDYREKNNYTRNDFMQLMINLKNAGKDEALTLEEIAAQCFLFFGAGLETSSSTMTFALYELAKNQNIQEKLRNEINTILANYQGEITYEAVQDMKYLDQVISETLRIYPPGPLTTRKCIKNYKIPGENIVIEKGTRVIIPIMGIHHDEEYYPNPGKFDPERFTEENKNLRHHYAHIPFGEGPRNCIGKRFGLAQSKVGLISLIKHYNFTVNRKTKEPLEYDTNSIVLIAKGDIWLNAQKI